MKRQIPHKWNGSKRFNKKWNLGVYSLYGFEIQAKSKKQNDIFIVLDKLVEYVESKHLFCCCGCNQNTIDGHIFPQDWKDNPVQDDKDNIEQILKIYFNDVFIGPWVNIRYDHLDCNYKGIK